MGRVDGEYGLRSSRLIYRFKADLCERVRGSYSGAMGLSTGAGHDLVIYRDLIEKH